MNYWNKKVIREQLEKRLESLREFSCVGVPEQGWVKTIREALGMSASQLGRRVGLHQSRVSRLESAEKKGNLKLSSLQKIAKGLGMKFVYGFVSNLTLEEIFKERAKNIASKRLERLRTTMSLEKQGLSSGEEKKAFDDMVEKIMIDPPKDFWDEGRE